MGRAGRRTRIGGDDAKKELEMKPTLKIALAFVALSSALTATAYARDGGGRHGDRHGGGRAGMMPSQAERLTPEQIRVLAAYVWGLSKP